MRHLLTTISAAFVLLIAAAEPIFGQTSDLPGYVTDIRVGEYFILAPDSIPAGIVTLRLTQTGDATKPWPADTAKLRADLTYHYHMVWVVRLEDGKTTNELFEAERDRLPTPWATIVGGPGYADAPSTSNVTVALTPGDYALVCYVGSARDDRNRYHLLKGMFRTLTVVGTPRPSTLPQPDLTIVMRGDSVIMADTLDRGHFRIAIRNETARRSDFAISRVKPGYTPGQARAWRPRLMTESPSHVVGGVVAIPMNEAVLTTVALDPGQYFFAGKHVVVR